MSCGTNNCGAADEINFPDRYGDIHPQSFGCGDIVELTISMKLVKTASSIHVFRVLRSIAQLDSGLRGVSSGMSTKNSRAHFIRIQIAEIKKKKYGLRAPSQSQSIKRPMGT